MTNAETARLAQLMAMYAAYYRVKLEDQVLRMYAEDLSDLNFADVDQALRDYRQDPKNKFMPLPAMIRDTLSPRVSEESAAREIAARIAGAIPLFGNPNPAQAKEYIGEIGWKLVQRYGGWVYLCEMVGRHIDITNFQAQIRELAIAEMKYDPQAMAKMIGLKPQAPKLQIAAPIQAEEPTTKELSISKLRELIASAGNLGRPVT